MINLFSSVWQFPYGCSVHRWSASSSYYLGAMRRGAYLFDAAKSAFLFRRASLLLAGLRRRRAPLLVLLPSSYPLLSTAGVLSTLSGTTGLLSNWFNKRPSRPLPSCLLLLDSSRSGAAVEGHRLGLPTVGIISADWDSSCFTHPIPLGGFSLSLLQSFLPPLGPRLVRRRRRFRQFSSANRRTRFRRPKSSTFRRRRGLKPSFAGVA